MAKIAYILLCHRDPAGVIRQAQSLVAAGDCVAIHYDARAPRADFETVRAAFGQSGGVTFPARRIRCGWGEWSLVQATVETLRAACDAFPDATHFYLVSGDCMAIKSAEYIRADLDDRPRDIIESHDFFATDWIKTGWRDERLVFRHWFNERTQKRRFYAMYEVQRRLGLRRRLPRDIGICIGSQWWCLRRDTVARILDFMQARPDVVLFFRLTWIPDETFFQTLVRHLVASDEIENRTPTFLMFSDYGMPVTFHNDHYDLLVNQSDFFARKIGRNAHDLQRRLGVLYAAKGMTFTPSDEGRALYAFLTGKGRVGQRFAPRFWERESTVGRERELMIVICKKWDVGKRMVGRIRDATGLACVDYLFNEDACPLPDLGGIESTTEKRHRHRRALLRMLYEHFEAERLVICLDPGSLDLLEDFGRDHTLTRMLEIECDYDDSWLTGHVQRVGLAGPRTPKATLERLLPTMRNAIRHEGEALRDARFDHFTRIRQGDPLAANVRALAAFLSVDADTARALLHPDDLFTNEEPDGF